MNDSCFGAHVEDRLAVVVDVCVVGVAGAVGLEAVPAVAHRAVRLVHAFVEYLTLVTGGGGGRLVGQVRAQRVVVVEAVGGLGAAHVLDYVGVEFAGG